MTTNGTDPQQVTGWNVQSQAPSPYAQAHVGAVPSFFAGNGSPGAPNPIPGDVTDILQNPGYADVNPLYLSVGMTLPADLVPVPESGTAFTNPTSMDCTVMITGDVTAVLTATYGGELSDATANGDGSYTVPAGGQIELTYTEAPAWTWTTARTLGAA